MSKLDPTSSIAAFYAGRSVLITGGTGFLGKVLVEKLLRSCPDIREIFLLMRPKKGLSIDDRLRKMFSLQLFDRLRKERPSAFEKVIPVTGDVAVEGLGLPPVERRVLIERTSVIFHVAASVRFDDNLRDAVFVNTRSTRDVCILAGSMKKLVALVHVSSTYAQADKPEVKEIPYPAEVDWKKTIKIAETVDDHMLRILTAKYLGPMPNTYTFTKRLAEQVICDYSNVLPCVIFRPSIVISTTDEPVKGWLDNFNGPVGMMAGGGKGVLRVLYVEPNFASDFIPVDVAIKAMLVSAWKRASKTVTQDPTPYVYNCASGEVKNLILREIIKMGLRLTEVVPLENVVWHPETIITESRTLYYILMLLLHLLPALIIDTVIKLSGKRPLLVKLQRKVYISNSSLSYFLTNEWKFRNEKSLEMLENIPPGEEEIFGFVYHNFNVHEYFKNCIIGAKLYLLNEDINQLDKAKKHYNRMWWIDRLLKVWLVVFVTWMVHRLGVFSYLLETTRSMLDGSIFED